MPTGKKPSSPPPSRQSNLIGRTIDDFEILEEIGRGGMGIVFRARQISLDRFVAFKILSQNLGFTEHAIGRFQREARATAKLNHPNIVPIYAQGQQDQTYYYAMELVSGRSLHDIIRELRNDGGPAGAASVDVAAGGSSAVATEIALAETRVIEREPGRLRKGNGQSGSDHAGSASGSSFGRSGSHSDPRFAGYTEDYFDEIARQIRDVADALEYAHREGVIHRDIKPHNLLVGRGGRLSLTDFGLARVLAQPGMTQTGEFVGTPLYMAPEQITGRGGAHDVAGDIYSLGATLYEWLTLSPPFPAATREQVISQIITTEVLPSRSRNRRVPIDLETICAKALEKEPNRRYRSAAEMRDDLDRFLRRSQIRAQRAGVLVSTARMLSRRRTGAIAAAALIVIAALVLLLVQERRAPRTPTPLPTTETPAPQVATIVEPPRAAEPARAAPTPTNSLSASMELGEQMAEALGGKAMLSGIFSTGKSDKYVATSDPQRLSAAFVLAEREREAARSALAEGAEPADPADLHYREALLATTADEALAGIAAALQADPEHADTLVLKAWTHCQLGEPQEMLAAADAVLAQAPDRADALLARSAALLQLGKLQSAEESLAQAAEEVKDYRVELLAGLIADERSQPDRALASFSRVLKTNPDNVLALMRSAKLNLAQGYVDAALSDLAKATQYEPGNAEAWGLRGECLDASKQYASAVLAYKRAYEISSQLTWLAKWLAAATNAEQQTRTASEGDTAKPAEPPRPDDIRRQDVVPPPPPAADAGGVHAWWQSFLNATREPQNAAGSFAPRMNARVP